MMVEIEELYGNKHYLIEKENGRIFIESTKEGQNLLLSFPINEIHKILKAIEECK